MPALLETSDNAETLYNLESESRTIMWLVTTTGQEFEDNVYEVQQNLEYVQAQLLHAAAIGLLEYTPFPFPGDTIEY